MKRFNIFLISIVFIFAMTGQAMALLISGQDIIAAPTSVEDDYPGAENLAQQAFDEAQNILLASNLAVDGGFIDKGTIVSSHMIFLNSNGNTNISDQGVDWTFDSLILGVMSDRNGTLEAASSSFLGAYGTTYPSAFSARGLESDSLDNYSISSNMITVGMHVTEPGDWIRVITAQSSAPVPEPATIFLLGTGLAGFFVVRRKSKK